MAKLTTEEFINKATKKYCNKYDYSKTSLENRRGDGKVCIICHEKDEDGIEHGEFWQLPSMHLFGKSCPKCGSHKKTTKTFIKEALIKNNHNFDYSKVEYKNIFAKIKIICKDCNTEFEITPHNLLKNRGCPYCSRANGTSFEQFITLSKQKHNNFYDYQKWDGLKKWSDKITISCHLHGNFEQRMENHLQGSGCPNCKNSKLETEVFNKLKEKNILFMPQKTFDWLKNKSNLRLDFYIPSKNIAIECQGSQHFVPNKFFGGEKILLQTQENDKIKKQLCEEHGIKILYYSKLNMEYPYEVYQNIDDIIQKVIE